MAIKLFSRKKAGEESASAVTRRGAAVPSSRKRGAAPPPRSLCTDDFVPAAKSPIEQDPLKQLFQQHRFAVIVKNAEKWRSHPEGEAIIRDSKQALEQVTSIVPAGSVSFPQTLTAQPGSSEDDIEVPPFLLNIHAVTNAEFQQFVDADGYDDLDYWPEDIWPHLIEFKDLAGRPGPRYWREGRHDARLGDHPVVGISWYEASAYAKWVGRRLPSEAEWQMAASWHINSSADLLRRFPWGDAMDNMRCNIWSSRHSSTVPVTDYPNGAAPNHVLQLIGNVWEWSSTAYDAFDDEGRQIIAEMPMQVVRGGAFDTYFETQATSQFRTGQITLARTHNLGLRCAMDLDQATWLDED